MGGANPHLPRISVAVFPPEEDGKGALVGAAQSGEAKLRSIVEEIAENSAVRSWERSAVQTIAIADSPDARPKQRCGWNKMRI